MKRSRHDTLASDDAELMDEMPPLVLSRVCRELTDDEVRSLSWVSP